MAMRLKKYSLPDDIGFLREIWRWIHRSSIEFFYTNSDGENEIYQTKTASLCIYLLLQQDFLPFFLAATQIRSIRNTQSIFILK